MVWVIEWCMIIDFDMNFVMGLIILNVVSKVADDIALVGYRIKIDFEMK